MAETLIGNFVTVKLATLHGHPLPIYALITVRVQDVSYKNNLVETDQNICCLL
jgi:hypothetical protein